MNTPKQLIPFIWAYTLIGLFSLVALDLNWLYVCGFFFLFALGNGTVGHRYFSHNSFKVAKPLHWILALWTTITGYSPIVYWIVQHRHHHAHTDQPEDVHSPRNGLLQAIFLWTVNKDRIDSVFKDPNSMYNYVRAMRDPAIRFFSTYHLYINLIFLLVLYIIDPSLLMAASAAYVLEQVRLAILNTVHHTPGIPLNYVNHSLKDSSQNNYVLGILTLGFGWHNNHHKNAKKLILTEKWWEIDLEGYVGWMLSKTSKQ